MSNPSVSIIIVNYNGRKHLERCLPSVLNTANVYYEIIVVDNASSDDSCDWIKRSYPDVRLLEMNKNQGFGKANTAGVMISRGEKIAFLNSDTETTPKWLKSLCDLLDSSQKVRATCSRLCLMDTPEIINAIGGGMSRLGYGFDHFYGYPEDHPLVVEKCRSSKSIPTLFPTAAAMLMRKEDFFEIGGFDPAFFMYHEDVDLGWRIWLSGKEVHVCPESLVYHYFGGTTKAEQSNRFRAIMGMRHNIRTLIKCHEKKRLLLVLLDILKMWKRRRALREMLHVISWNLLHLPGTLMQRWNIRKAKKISDGELLDKGLLLSKNFPPSAPVIPSCSLDKIRSFKIESPVLNLTSETAINRMGPGWYQIATITNRNLKEASNGTLQTRYKVSCRWTCGYAKCYLKLAPHITGTLRINLYPPQAQRNGESTWVRFVCGKNETTLTLPENEKSQWHQVEVSGKSDSNGVLTLYIISSTWIPDNLYHNGDCRRLGCAIHDVTFIPDLPRMISVGSAPENLSIIIPTYNRKDILIRTLDALQKQTISGFQVITVDDGSTDGTQEAVKAWMDSKNGKNTFDLEIIRQPNMKQGQARNRGLESAKGNLIVFLGDDIIPDPGFIQAHTDGHRKYNTYGDVAILGLIEWDLKQVKVTPFLNHINYKGAQFGYGHLKPEQEAPFTCFYTSNISISRSLLGQRPFNTLFSIYGWEDTELGFRLCSQGVRIIYYPDARAVHSHPMTLNSFLKRQEQVGEAIDTLLTLHPDVLTMPSLSGIGRNAGLSHIAPALICIAPLLDIIDRYCDKPLPKRFYNLILGIAFAKGWKKVREKCTISQS